MPPISINVNVDKVDKARFFEGKKGRYMDLVLFETPDSEYGDYMVKQRGEKGERMPILGNGKYFKPKGTKTSGNKPADNNDDGEPKRKDPW
jgi:hypothetical protein